MEMRNNLTLAVVVTLVAVLSIAMSVTLIVGMASASREDIESDDVNREDPVFTVAPADDDTPSTPATSLDDYTVGGNGTQTSTDDPDNAPATTTSPDQESGDITTTPDDAATDLTTTPDDSAAEPITTPDDVASEPITTPDGIATDATSDVTEDPFEGTDRNPAAETTTAPVIDQLESNVTTTASED